MAYMKWSHRLLVSLIVVASSLAIVDSAYASGGSYTNALDLNAGSLWAVSCQSVSNCTAVGSEVGYTPIATKEIGGVWGPNLVISPAYLGEGAVLNGVSCVDASDCTAIGEDPAGFVVYVKETAGQWGTLVALTTPTSMGQVNLVSISCPTINNCTAVGNDEYGDPILLTESGGIWGNVTVAPSNWKYENLLGIDCTADGNCTVVGGATDVYLSGGNPLILNETGGVWGSPQILSGIGQFNSVSCADATDCTAVGTGFLETNFDPLYDSENGGVWQTPTTANPVNVGLGSWFNSVSCTDASNCTAVGTTSLLPISEVETSGVWAAPTLVNLPANSAGGVFRGVSCYSANLCTEVGDDGTTSKELYAQPNLTLLPTPKVIGPALVGRTLTTRVGQLDSGVTLSYQWYLNGVAIKNATTPTYELMPVTLFKAVTVRVQGVLPGYEPDVSFSVKVIVRPGHFSSSPLPRISGSTVVGKLLKIVSGKWPPGATLRYKWFSNQIPISGATRSQYVIRTSDIGHTIRVEVVASEKGYTSISRSSRATKRISPAS